MRYFQKSSDFLIDRLRESLFENVVLIGEDERYEIKDPPCLILRGPKLVPKGQMTSLADHYKVKPNKKVDLYTGVRYYNLEFTIQLNCKDQGSLFEWQDAFIRFVHAMPVLEVDPANDFCFGFEEITPLGDLEIPNLSRLRQYSGLYRIENVPNFTLHEDAVGIVESVQFDFEDEAATPSQPLETLVTFGRELDTLLTVTETLSFDADLRISIQ